jgi:hypothetical protein
MRLTIDAEAWNSGFEDGYQGKPPTLMPVRARHHRELVLG